MLHGCTSSRLGPASSPVPPTRRECAHAFPVLVRRRRVLCSSRAVPSPRYMCFRSVSDLTLSVFVCRAFVASSLSLTPVLLLPPAYVPCSIAALLALVFLLLSSRRSPAPAGCVPVSAVCSSAPRLHWLPTRSALDHQDVRHLYSVLSGKGRPCHIAALRS